MLPPGPLGSAAQPDRVWLGRAVARGGCLVLACRGSLRRVCAPHIPPPPFPAEWRWSVRPTYEGRPPRPSREGGRSGGSLGRGHGPGEGTRGVASGNEAEFAGTRHGLGAVSRAELVEDVAGVFLDRLHGDHQLS